MSQIQINALGIKMNFAPDIIQEMFMHTVSVLLHVL